MTAQQSLSRVWASTGSSTDPGAANYAQGWVAEIPTFQEFNYVLGSATANILALAEKQRFDWEADINYEAGAKVERAGFTWFAIQANVAQDPSLDTNRNFWRYAPVYGPHVPTVADSALGLHLNEVSYSGGLWSDQAATITGIKAVVAYNTTSGGLDNFLMGNIGGYMQIVDVGTVASPDGRNVADGQAGVHRIFHQGNPPNISEVVNGVEEAAQDGTLYARIDGNWVAVTSTVVSEAPPPPTTGAGQGWYNLEDGVHYTDINDGDSSQWVPSSPARTILASKIPYDNSVSGLTATTMQAAIDELAALHP